MARALVYGIVKVTKALLNRNSSLLTDYLAILSSAIYTLRTRPNKWFVATYSKHEKLAALKSHSSAFPAPKISHFRI